MTFTEAAIEVLRREGKPLHFKKIAEIAIREGLLDHVGKIPEEILGGQLVTHCKLPKPDRRVIAVQPGTFALAEWGLDEDPNGLDGMIEPPPELELPYRPRERHPVPSKEVARSVPRSESSRGRRREEGEERRPRRFPPPAEVAYEFLAGAGHALSLVEIATQGGERSLMPDAFVRDTSALQAALEEDNRRRESGGRKPLFALEGEQVSLVAQPEPGERAAPPPAAVTAPRLAPTPGDLRRGGLQSLRRKLRESDGPTVEHVCALLLERTGLRELKVAKRGREHAVYTARRRMGLADVRHCVRVVRGGGEVSRRDVTEMRRDLGHYGAQIGLVLSAGEAARDARSEACAAGQLPVLLLCGEALAEAFAEAGVGCTQVVVPEVDEAFFSGAAEAAAVEETARRARREERDRREGREPREGREGERRERPAPEKIAEAPPSTADAAPIVDITPSQQPAQGEPPPILELRLEKSPEPASEEDGDEGEGGEGEDEGPEAAQPAQPGVERPAGEGEGRRRRRRRRRRGGRGRGRGEGVASEGTPSAASEGTPPAETAGATAPSSEPAPPASNAPGDEGGGEG